ncbi:hypothetical protein EVY19_18935, partial [Escherichia coli]
ILRTPVGSRVMRRDYGSLLASMIDQPQTPAREFLNICESVHACEIAQYIKVMLSGFICRTTIQHSRRA